jgi:TPP-dependent pyruvate/acetoin dehydrogenase alpha subunit
LGRDCLRVAEASLTGRGWLDEASIEAWRRELHQTVEDAVDQVRREPPPDPYREEWTALSTERLREGPPSPAS